MFRIGMDYDDGNGVEQNSESAFEWYMKAAEKGDLHAQFNVGFMFETGEVTEITTDTALISLICIITIVITIVTTIIVTAIAHGHITMQLCS